MVRCGWIAMKKILPIVLTCALLTSNVYTVNNDPARLCWFVGVIIGSGIWGSFDEMHCAKLAFHTHAKQNGIKAADYECTYRQRNMLSGKAANGYLYCDYQDKAMSIEPMSKDVFEECFKQGEDGEWHYSPIPDSTLDRVKRGLRQFLRVISGDVCPDNWTKCPNALGGCCPVESEPNPDSWVAKLKKWIIFT